MNILTTVLASSTNSTSTISNVEPGLLGFLVVAALGLALVFLLRSMNKQFKKIGPKPEESEAESAGVAGASVAGASAAASQRPLRGLAAHRAATAAAEADAEPGAKRDLPGRRRLRRAHYSDQARRIASGSPHQPRAVRRSSESIAPSTDHIAVTCRKSPSMLSSSKSSSNSS